MAFLSNSMWQNCKEHPNRSNGDMVKKLYVKSWVSKGVSEGVSNFREAELQK